MMIIILCYSMTLYHKGPSDPAMPQWMRKYVLNWLSYKLGTRDPSDDVFRNDALSECRTYMLPTTNETHANQEQLLKLLLQKNQFERTKSKDVYEKATEWLYYSNQCSRRPHSNNTSAEHKVSDSQRSRTDGYSDGYTNNNNSPSYKRPATQADVKSLSRKLDVMIGKLLCDEKQAHVKEEWRIVAVTFDRLCLILFFVILCSTVFGCFRNVPGYVP